MDYITVKEVWYAFFSDFNIQAGSIPRFCKHSFFEIADEIFSVAIFSLPLIKVELLSVAGEILCTEYW